MAKEIQYQVNATIEGTHPLLIHKYNADTKKKTTRAEDDYSEEWKKEVHLGMIDPYVIFPYVNIEMSLREAAKGQKIGKKYLTRILPVGIDIQEFEIPILDPDGNYIYIEDIERNDWLMTCPVVINKNRVPKTRVQLPRGWHCSFTINVLNPLITSDIMKDLIQRAGDESGLGVWRPSSPKPGKFGQFDLVEFDLAS